MTIEKIISIAEIRAEIASHVYGAELLLQHAMLNINAMERKINQLISERNALAAKLSEIERAEPVAWVPVHPRSGPLWSIVRSTPGPDRLLSYTFQALYFGHASAPAKREPLTDERIAAYERVREEFEIVRDIGRDADIDSAMLTVDSLLRAHGIGAVVEKPAINTPETAQPVDSVDVLCGGPVGVKCDCRACITDRGDKINGLPRLVGQMILCPKCGNKRCPHANDHRHACTGSNEAGQPGSAYPGGGA